MGATVRYEASVALHPSHDRRKRREAPLTKPTPRPTVLVACVANVCRSPLAEFILQEAFESADRFDTVRVASAGTTPQRGRRICELVRTSSGGPGWTDFAERHRARAVTSYKIAGAKLILTASVGGRAAIAAMDASARSRTFTLREAAWLGAGFDAGDLSGSQVVEAFAAYVHGRRGLVPLPPVKRSLPWRREFADPWSIVDGHNLDDRAHRSTLAAVRASAGTIAGLLVPAGTRTTAPTRRSRNAAVALSRPSQDGAVAPSIEAVL